MLRNVLQRTEHLQEKSKKFLQCIMELSVLLAGIDELRHKNSRSVHSVMQNEQNAMLSVVQP